MADKYYAMIDGEQKGPFTLEELGEAGIRPSTYIWCKGLPDWQKAEDNAEVCRLFRNRLYDIMHPTSGDISTGDASDPYKVEPDSPTASHPTRFDRYLQETGEDPLPTLDEIESKKDTSTPPVSMIGYAWLVTILCFWPTGIVALVYAYKSRKAWHKGDNTLSHEYCRRAMMWTGVTFFLGLIAYSLFFALSM